MVSLYNRVLAALNFVYQAGLKLTCLCLSSAAIKTMSHPAQAKGMFLINLLQLVEIKEGRNL